MPPTHPVIFGEFLRWHVAPEKLDSLLANGWRRFGPQFYRYSLMLGSESVSRVLPLRIDLTKFHTSKSQRRVLRRNADLSVTIARASLDPSREQMFEAHKRRFKDNRPPSLRAYLGPRPDSCPCETMELAVYQDHRLLAASYLDLGRNSVSSVYGMFDPAESRRSLGIFTMLLEISFASQRHCRFYYPGYALDIPSPYDYKKHFSATEYFDWLGHWLPLSE